MRGIGWERRKLWVGMRGIRVKILYRSPIDELKLWRGIEIKKNVRIYINIDMTVLYES